MDHAHGDLYFDDNKGSQVSISLTGQCDKCGTKTVCAEFDQSAGEYVPVILCAECLRVLAQTITDIT